MEKGNHIIEKISMIGTSYKEDIEAQIMASATLCQIQFDPPEIITEELFLVMKETLAGDFETEDEKNVRLANLMSLWDKLDNFIPKAPEIKKEIDKMLKQWDEPGSEQVKKRYQFFLTEMSRHQKSPHGK